MDVRISRTTVSCPGLPGTVLDVEVPGGLVCDLVPSAPQGDQGPLTATRSEDSYLDHGHREPTSGGLACGGPGRRGTPHSAQAPWLDLDKTAYVPLSRGSDL